MMIKRDPVLQPKLRLKLVHHAQKYGIKAASKYFSCSRNTIRKWLKRYQGKGSTGLVNRPRIPLKIPHKTFVE